MPETEDDFLARVLHERPEFPIPGDLASIALARARHHGADRIALQQLARRARLLSMIASTLVVMLTLLAIAAWPAASAAQQSATDLSSSGEFAGWEPLAGILLACLAVAALWRAASMREDRWMKPAW
jgi:hypothetical protein